MAASEATAREENWPWERTQYRVWGIRDSVDELIKTGKTSRRDTAMEDWAAEVRAIAEEAVQDAKEVLVAKSTNYVYLDGTA
jgi:hypothetical protein